MAWKSFYARNSSIQIPLTSLGMWRFSPVISFVLQKYILLISVLILNNWTFYCCIRTWIITEVSPIAMYNFDNDYSSIPLQIISALWNFSTQIWIPFIYRKSIWLLYFLFLTDFTYQSFPPAWDIIYEAFYLSAFHLPTLF